MNLLITIPSTLYLKIDNNWLLGFHYFSFKKTNFKALSDFYKKNLLLYRYPLKSPIVLIVIFWFVYIVSFFCIFKYFNYTSGLLGNPLTDLQVTPLALTSLPSHTPQSAITERVNYLFNFYSLFTGVAFALVASYANRRSGWPSLLYLISFIFYFLFFLFIFI